MSNENLTGQEQLLWETYLNNGEDLEKTAKELGILPVHAARLISSVKKKLKKT